MRLTAHRSISIIALLFAAAFVSQCASAVPSSADKVVPLDEGATIPAVTLRTLEGKTVDLRDACSKKPTVLIFYRGGWCPICRSHLSALQRIEADLKGLGYQLLAISPDRPEKLRETLGKRHLTYTLLSDSSMTVARAFGLAFVLDAATREQYAKYGVDLAEASGETHYMLPVPAVYIVGTDGKIQYRFYDPDYKVRLKPENLLKHAGVLAASP